MSLEAASDAELLRAIAAGDGAAFAVLVQRHHGRAYALAWRVMGQRADAEDVVQDVMLKLWRQAERFDPARGSFPAWLARMVTNQCLDRRRQIKPVESLDLAAELADPGANSAADAERRALDSVLATLAPRQRAVLALFYLEGYAMAEIATMLETNEKAVESLLSRARAALRARFGRSDALGNVQ